MTRQIISYPKLIVQAIELSIIAGNEILKVYSKEDFQVEEKTDQSPLTLADMKSHNIIVKGLKSSEIPVLSEESQGINWEERKEWERYWLVDPLDGTKEFIKRNDEFTVNIALIEKGIPVMGVIYVPVFDVLYFALQDTGSFKIIRPGNINAETSFDDLMQEAVKLPAFTQGSQLRVVASRSHISPETKLFIDGLDEKYGEVKTVAAGSSLKLCLVAEGNAEIYPRMGPTMEWDIAAGHVIVTESGGSILKTDNTDLVYNKPDLLNPWFVVRSKSYLDGTLLSSK